MPSRWLQAVLAVLMLLGCTVLFIWQWTAEVAPWRLVLAWGMFGVLAAHAAWWFRHLPDGELSWTGADWRWRTGRLPEKETDGQVLLALDWQWGLLLQLRPFESGQAPHWVVLQKRTLPPRWHALRCAVYSRAAHMPPGPR